MFNVRVARLVLVCDGDDLWKGWVLSLEFKIAEVTDGINSGYDGKVEPA